MKISDKPIYVTQPNLPDLDDFVDDLRKIWDSKWLTNVGSYHKTFESELADFLGVRECNLFSNGTLALLVGLQSLRITGEVITSPFSFVATTHALKWNGITPVFCDIDEETLTLDPSKVESVISNKTTALLPVHVYGNPCDVHAIDAISNLYGLKVIYDAAHAFGVTLHGESVLKYGDISILSFHATKVFNTIEGGGIVHNDEHLKKRIDFLKNFGFADETTVIGTGINAKMNELQAAYGLLQLKIFNREVRQRGEIADMYRRQFEGVAGLRVFHEPKEVKHNYSYFPILIDGAEFGESRDNVYSRLRKYNIHARRYFYPLISHFPPYRNLASSKPSNLPVAEKIAKQVLCLPIYGELAHETVDDISSIILENQ